MKTYTQKLVALALASTASLMAQTVSAPPAEPAEKTLALETFVVNTAKDNGYIAVDSLAGGRTNTPIKFTPASMSSVTRTFIDDLGIQNVREALQWTPNVVPEDRNAGKGFGGAAFHDWSFNYRGAGAGQQGGPGPTRNYFSFYQNADSYNIERIEFLRGPNSLVFGLGTVGGTLSTYTKVPRTDKDFLQPTVTMDTSGSARFEVDFNRRLSDTVALRLNAVHDQNRGWRNNDKNDIQAVDLSLQYKPADNTTLRIEGEYAKIEKTLISTTIGDKISGWDGTTASNTWGATPVGAARTEHIQNAGAWGDWLSPFWVYTPGLTGVNTLTGWAGGWASTTSQTETWAALNYQPYKGWYPDQVKLPWHSSYASTAKIPVLPSREWTYGSGLSNIDYKNLTAFLDHKFSDNVEGSASFYRYTDAQTAKDYEGTGGAAIDINRQLPNGASNPYFGKAFADFFLSKQTQNRTVDEARVQLNYHFDSTLFGHPWKQLISASAAVKEVNISARQYLAQVGNGTSITNPADWVFNMIWGRLYLDQPNQKMNIPEVVNGRSVAYLPKADGYWFDFDDTFKLNDLAVMSHSRLFDDKLSVLAGIRHDSYEEHIRELRRAANNKDDRLSDEREGGTTYSAGAVYYFNWLGVFANYSENIQPPNPGSQPSLNGSRPSPEAGTGLDYGFRISTGDGKYYATLSRYDTTSDGHLVENPIGLRGIWQKYYDSKPSVARDPKLNDLAYSDTTARDVSGYEFELTANPTKNLRLQASYAKPDAKVVDYYPGARAYYATNLATWNTAIATADTVSHGDALRAEIASVKNALDQALPGAKEGGLVKFTANFFANYTFTNETLKGLSVGGGVAYTGKSFAGVLDNQEYYGSKVMTTNAVIAYETKIGKVPARFALNIANVLDDKDPIITNYHWGYTGADGKHIADGYLLPAPRVIRLSARFTF